MDSSVFSINSPQFYLGPVGSGAPFHYHNAALNLLVSMLSFCLRSRTLHVHVSLRVVGWHRCGAKRSGLCFLLTMHCSQRFRPRSSRQALKVRHTMDFSALAVARASLRTLSQAQLFTTMRRSVHNGLATFSWFHTTGVSYLSFVSALRSSICVVMLSDAWF